MERRRRHVQVRRDGAQAHARAEHRAGAVECLRRQPRVAGTADASAVSTGALLPRAHLLAVRGHGCPRRAASAFAIAVTAAHSPTRVASRSAYARAASASLLGGSASPSGAPSGSTDASTVSERSGTAGSGVSAASECTGRELNPQALRRRNLKPGWHPRILRGSRKQAPRAIRVAPKSGVFTRAWGNRGAIRPPRKAAKTRSRRRSPALSTGPRRPAASTWSCSSRGSWGPVASRGCRMSLS